MFFRSIVVASFCFFFCVGCDKHELDPEKLVGKSPKEIYDIGQAQFKLGRYADAALAFEEVENQHPYSNVVAEAQLALGESYIKLKKYDEASAALESFIQAHTAHEQVAYGLYMLGQIHFEQMPIIPRDQDVTVKSLEYFQELCLRFPKSQYCKDAKAKIKILVQQLANQEFRTGYFYQKKKNFAAAIARYNTVIEHYPQTDTAQEAHHRLVECYLSLGLPEEARVVFERLSLHHKGSKWIPYSADLIAAKAKQ